ncbi:MAG: DUF2157 domain-containing protein [Planctomycetota bacterium]
MDIQQESKRWLTLGIIDEEQRAKILSLYAGQGSSLAVLAFLWVGGALVFLGLSFLLAMIWNELGAARGFLVGLLDAVFFGGGALLRRTHPESEKSSMALLVIGGLLLPLAIGVTWEDLFGSSGHFLPLVALCGALYALLAVRLRSRAFCCLFAAALFFAGEEVIRDRAFDAFFPLVQLGVVDRLEHVFPLVFLTLGGALAGLSFAAGRVRGYTELRGTLLACGLLLALLPAIVGACFGPYKDLKMFLAIAGALGGMGVSVLLRQSRCFWLSGACLVLAFLVLFGEFFHDSAGFFLFAIVVGLVTMGAGSYLATRRGTWFDRLFAEEEEELLG